MNNYLKSLVDERKSKGEERNDDIKNISAINLANIIEYIKSGISEDDFNSLCRDIKSGKVKFGMDKNAVNIVLNNQENPMVQKFLKIAKMSAIDIDINDLTELSSEKVNAIQNLGIEIGKIYVNSGWDEGAAKGYSANVYKEISNSANKMYQSAKGKLEKQNPGKSFESMSDRDKFMAIYNIVISGAKYNKNAIEEGDSAYYTSRNLQDFFLRNKTAVCAGFADALVQLCKMSGLEVEYVQGDSKSAKMENKEYHAWVRVKIDGKWYNADPTWDANKVKGEYGYCLKSDKDFDGHWPDSHYTPSYKRSSDNKSISSRSYREYESADYSFDSSDLANRYYTSDMEHSLEGYRNLTQEEAAKMRENYVPNAAPSSTGLLSGSSFLTIFFNLLIKLTSFPLKVAHSIKEKFHSQKLNKGKLAGNDFNEYIEQIAKEEENTFSHIRFDTSKAKSEQESHTKSDDKQQDHESR